jgi:hypothetical protein
MTIPRFNAYGLLPPGFHLATMTELQKQLGFSPKRHSLIEEGLKHVAQQLLAIRIRYLFIGGSFVTDKLSPDDLDGYVLAPLGSSAYRGIVERQEVWRVRYRMDIYPAATDIEGYGSQAYWEEWFGRTPEELPLSKGIVKLFLGRG